MNRLMHCIQSNSAGKPEGYGIMSEARSFCVNIRVTYKFPVRMKHMFDSRPNIMQKYIIPFVSYWAKNFFA